MHPALVSAPNFEQRKKLLVRLSSASFQNDITWLQRIRRDQRGAKPDVIRFAETVRVAVAERNMYPSRGSLAGFFDYRLIRASDFPASVYASSGIASSASRICRWHRVQKEIPCFPSYPA